MKLVAATYLLVLAVAAVLGWHRGLLTYPFRALYSVFRILIIVLTFGRIRLTSNAKRTRRRSARRLREARSVFGDYRQRRAEERAIARGEDPFTPTGGWASAAEAPDAGTSEFRPVPTPVPTPASSPSADDEADDAPPRLY